MLSPEKNDVDIKKLFNWNEKVTIYGVDGIENETVYMRLIGDADWNKSRVKALRASAELRKKLKDENSDEFLAYIPIKEQVDKDALIEMMVILNMSDFRDEVIKNIDIPFPKEPSPDATLEDLEEYQKELDNFEEARLETIKEELTKISEREKEKLSKRSFDKLYDEYVQNLVNTLCKEELNKVFISYSVYFGSYKDAEFTEKYFDSYETFINLPTAVKNQFMDSYLNIDIGVYELKK